MTDQTGNFESPNHALFAGMLWGLLLRAGIDAVPEADDDLNYTDVIRINFEDTYVRVRVLP